ncbi:MAG: ATP-binding protein [Salinivirgaceae bacterium]|jgi:ATP-dependent DNA helicase RecG
MNINIPQILEKGEGISVEFKRANSKLPDSLFETICAFLNRNGGTILLGVDDDKTLWDIDPKIADTLCKNISNLSNNPQ